MAELILHHYELSPFSEKIRRILAYKKIPWHAVDQPIMAPKPDLTPLTGGYRRIPVMQIGADIFCDTALIAREIEARFAQPETIPAADAGAIALIEDWADHRLFMHAVPPTLVGIVDALPPGFLDDRAEMTPAFQKQAIFDAAPHALGQLRHALDHLAGQLAQRDFLIGSSFTLADAACFHCARFILNNPDLGGEVSSRPKLAAWLQRIDDYGPGDVSEMNPADALAIARDASPEPALGANNAVSANYALGDEITITADDYGREITTGKATHIGVNRVTVQREDPSLGTVAVHYPRAGYRIEKSA